MSPPSEEYLAYCKSYKMHAKTKLRDMKGRGYAKSQTSKVSGLDINTKMFQSLDRAFLARLAQKLALLWLLNDLPEEPSDNYSKWDTERNNEAAPGSRKLTLLQERKIVEAFALFAAKTDDPKKIVAACIEEGRDGRSMVVNLAVNNGILDDVERKFRRMALILQEISTNKRIQGAQILQYPSIASRKVLTESSREHRP